MLRGKSTAFGSWNSWQVIAQISRLEPRIKRPRWIENLHFIGAHGLPKDVASKSVSFDSEDGVWRLYLSGGIDETIPPLCHARYVELSPP